MANISLVFKSLVNEPIEKISDGRRSRLFVRKLSLRKAWAKIRHFRNPHVKSNDLHFGYFDQFRQNQFSFQEFIANKAMEKKMDRKKFLVRQKRSRFV